MPNHVLLVHAAGASWTELRQELAARDIIVHTASTLRETEDWLGPRRPDVLVIDVSFEQGIDLLLAARQTASGTLIVAVRELCGAERLFGATMPGPTPRYIAPLTAAQLAGEVRAALAPPPAVPVGRYTVS